MQGVVERGVGGRGFAAAWCKLSCVREVKSSLSVSGAAGGGGRGGCGSVAVRGAVGPESLGAPECIIVECLSLADVSNVGMEVEAK